MTTRMRWGRAVALCAMLVLGAPAPATGAVPSEPAAAQWRWPVAGFRLVRPYEAPAHAYGPGHRGIDLAPESPEVYAPAGGVIAFSGAVAGRGVLTIDHGDGLVTTFEPVLSDLVAGHPVVRGSLVAVLSEGGHAAPGTLHFGVRRDGEYINPLLLLGGVPRAILLPCC
jgi:murein DD-endopeptidase MepM/ murein hydrolase activator NlpD